MHAEKLLEFRHLRIGKYVARRTNFMDATPVHEDDARADVTSELHFVRHHQQRHAITGKFADVRAPFERALC